jgi:hypothetical protein
LSNPVQFTGGFGRGGRQRLEMLLLTARLPWFRRISALTVKKVGVRACGISHTQFLARMRGTGSDLFLWGGFSSMPSISTYEINQTETKTANSLKLGKFLQN